MPLHLSSWWEMLFLAPPLSGYFPPFSASLVSERSPQPPLTPRWSSEEGRSVDRSAQWKGALGLVQACLSLVCTKVLCWPEQLWLHAAGYSSPRSPPGQLLGLRNLSHISSSETSTCVVIDLANLGHVIMAVHEYCFHNLLWILKINPWIFDSQ